MTLTSDAPARDSAAHPAPKPASAAAVLAGIVILVGVGFFFYTKSDLWLDEALSVNIARLPVSDMLHWLKHDGAPPLYYLLLHVWTGVFGTGDEAVRALSGVMAIGAAVAAYFAGRRVSGPATGWAAVVLFMSNPYAARYATETRMYMLETLIVMCGFLAFVRALERPSLGRLATFALLTALGLYTQYWMLYLGVVVGAMLVFLAWRGRPEQRDAARKMIVAMVVGAITFVPWLPTFLYQAKHTGTPWGQKQLPPEPIGRTMIDFAGGFTHEGWVLFFVSFAVLLLAVFGLAVDKRHIMLDLATRPATRWIAFVLAAALVVGTSLDYLSGGAFQTRYSAYVFPFWLLLVAHGLTTFSDRRVRVGVLAFMVLVGFIGEGRNANTNRTEAAKVATVLKAEAKPHDVVVYCPDQLGPSVHRLAPKGLDEFSYPASKPPAVAGQLVDWVDYTKRIDASDPTAFAHEILRLAGNRTIWLVTAPGYRTHIGRCEAMTTVFASVRRYTARVAPDDTIFEMPGLQQFTTR